MRLTAGVVSDRFVRVSVLPTAYFGSSKRHVRSQDRKGMRLAQKPGPRSTHLEGVSQMSMLGNFRQISGTLLERIKAEPTLVRDVLRYRPAEAVPASDAEAFLSLLPGHMRKAVENMPPDTRQAFLDQFTQSLADMPDILKQQIAEARRPKPSKAAFDVRDFGEELDIEKAWHGIHFLLCGVIDEAPPPLGDAVLGGTEIGPDLGYGPARYLEPYRVKAVAEALEAIQPKAFAARFDASRLQEHQIYPSAWSQDCKEWIEGAYSELRGFYAAAAKKGLAVLLYIM
jgi:hypothetical protein